MRRLIAVLFAASLHAIAWNASAFCRTTTCNELEENCVTDQMGCMTAGHPLFWRGRCMSFGVDQRGSPKRGISFEAALASITQAYVPWTTADCGGGQTPSLEIFQAPKPIACDHQEYNSDDGNSNAWIFYDADWPHDSIQLALTTLSFAESGEIYDVDVEINTADHDIALEPLTGQDDFLSVCTHEAGHFFGLAHSRVPGSTMENQLSADTSMRTLEADDISGICTIYPPGREAPACSSTRTPRHGFSAECGDHSGANDLSEDAGCCSMAPGRRGGSAWLLLVAVSAALGLIRLRAAKAPAGRNRAVRGPARGARARAATRQCR